MQCIIMLLLICSSIFAGIAVDVYGPTKCAIASSLLFGTAFLLFGVADSEDVASFNLAGVLLGSAMSLAFVNGFPLACLVDSNYTSMIMTSLNCLFDASAAVFAVLYFISSSSNLSRQAIFVPFAIFAYALYGAIAVLWSIYEQELNQPPDKLGSDLTPSPSANNLVLSEETSPLSDWAPVSSTSVDVDEPYRDMLSDSNTSVKSPFHAKAPSGDIEMVELNTSVNEFNDVDNNGGDAVGLTSVSYDADAVLSLPWHKHLFRQPFVFIGIYAPIQVLRVTIFFGGILGTLRQLGDDNDNYFYTNVLFAILPLSFIFIPMIEFCLQRYGMLFSFRFTTVLGYVYSGLLLIPSLPIQIVTFILFCGFRAFLFSVIGVYFVQHYGVKSSGRLYGAMSLFNSFLNFLQYPAFILANRYDHGSVFFINLSVLLLAIPCTMCVEWLLAPLSALYRFADTKVVKDDKEEIILAEISSPILFE